MTLPLFSYPSTIVCVDDNELFLNVLSRLLSINNSVMSFGLPQESIDFLEKYTPLLQKTNFTRGCMETDKYDMLNHMPVDLSAGELLSLRGNPDRNLEITVLVADYNMPDINGIELCRKLSHLPMKKILLTGEADNELAVTAFNEGIIDAFIRKESQSLVKDIEFHTQRLIQQYFFENTKRLRNHLETDFFLPLSDPCFSAFFTEWCSQNNIQEYYLIDKQGNILLINEDGEKIYFIVHTDRTLNNFIELHDEDIEARCFLDSVKSRKKIPFFGEGVEGWELCFDQWPACFYSTNILTGKNKYYWYPLQIIG